MDFRKKQGINYREASSELESDEGIVARSTSKFGYKEERFLRIKIKTVPEFWFNSDTNIVSSLMLEEYNRERILTLQPNDALDQDQSRFLIKLKRVLLNNAAGGGSRKERLIDDLCIELFRCAEFDDGKVLTMTPSYLELSVDNVSYAAEIDREGRKGEHITWLLQENKHSYDTRYEQGDIQIVACMIAACQTNLLIHQQWTPMIQAIKVSGDKFYFYKAEFSRQYIDGVWKGIVDRDLHVHKYPENGLALSDPVQRKQILLHLAQMRANIVINF